jgi:DtxR family Mn-dependent transcriptional regulator
LFVLVNFLSRGDLLSKGGTRLSAKTGKTSRPARDKRLTASLEDYIEAILLLVRRGRVARVRDIARAIGVGMPSVTAALKTLSKRGMVNYDPYEVVTLTDRGREVAEDVSNRHTTIRRFLTEVLSLTAEEAEANACRIEHAIDGALLERLAALVDYMRRCPRVSKVRLADFGDACRRGDDPAECRRCIASLADEHASGGADG